MLEKNAFYEVAGMVMFAITPDTLVPPGKPNTASVPTPQDGARFMYGVGHQDWVTRMVDLRQILASQLDQAEGRERHWIEKYEALGQALRDKAEEKEWCEEYNEFASEWDLPQLSSEYHVTITLTIRARNEDMANDYIQGAVRLDSYDDEVVSGPEIDIMAVPE